MTVALRIPISLHGTGAVVTDPCYYEGSDHMIHEVNKIQQGGLWHMEAYRESFGMFGTRTAELTVVHSSHSESDEKEYAWAAGVDSGQLSICGSIDAEKFKNEDFAFDQFDPDGNAGEFNYEGACEITLKGDHAGVLCEKMAVSETGCGDGVYPVLVWRNQSGIATKITIDFRDHPLLGEDEDDDV